MVLGNFLAGFNILPSWLWHAPWNGFSVADLGVPIFLLAIGASYQLSFSKRIIQNGKLATIFHFVIRYLTLFAFGFGGYLLVMGKIQWEALQMIGAVGLFALGFMFIMPSLRIIIALMFIIIYQTTIHNGAKPWVMDFAKTGLGGPYATFSWGFVLLFGSALASWVNKRKEQMTSILIFWTAVLVVIGLLLSPVIPFNKHLVSLSYIMLTTGIAVAGLLLFHAITSIWHQDIPIFDSIGRNALVCYITSQLLSVIADKFLPDNVGILILLICAIAVLLICITLARLLDTKKLYIRL
jgi:predicted acyltransferase